MKLLRPVDARWPITQRFGENLAYYRGYGYNGHNGLDYGCPVGTPVRAAHNGIVEYGETDAGPYGVYLDVVHLGILERECWFTRYAHLSRRGMADGSGVRAGEDLALSGNTGNSTGPHLHLGLRLNVWAPDDPWRGWRDPEPYLKEKKMASKLGFHIHKPEYPEWLQEHVRLSGANYVKIMNPHEGIAQPFGTSVFYIGRNHFGEGEPDKQLIAQGAAGADAWWNMAWPRMRLCPWITYWEGPNEPDVSNEVACQHLAEFEERRVKIMHAAQLKTLSYCISTGNPPDMGFWEILAHGITETDGLALHEYGMKRMVLDGYNLLRYRQAAITLWHINGNTPPIFITETGIDCGGDKSHGWQNPEWGCSEDDYLAQLISYDHELQKDDYIVVATPFTWQTPDWWSFRIIESLSGKLARYMASEQDIEDVIGAEAQRHILPLNPNAAFEVQGAARGMLPASGEFDVPFGLTTYRAQAYRHPDRRGKQYIIYARVGDWANPLWFEWSN